MPRTFLTALALCAITACGGGKPSARAASKAAASRSHRAATRSTAAKGKTQRKPGARPDTTTQRNPLMNR
jgi:hypothetical protein